MIIYCICYLTSFLLAQAGWNIPSGLVLIGTALWMYWQDYKKSGNLIHLRGLFFLGFVGGQGVSCLKLSRLQTPWSWMTWLCFFGAAAAFYIGFSMTIGKGDDGMQGLFPETSGMSRLLPCGFPAWEEKEAGRLQIPAACLYPFWELPAFP